MAVSEWILTGIAILLAVMVYQLANLTFVFRNTMRLLTTGLGQDFTKFNEQHHGHLYQLSQDISELKETLDAVRFHLEDISHVMQIIEKYKLPPSSERRRLDDAISEMESWALYNSPQPKGKAE
jgi:hypothetical protein